MGKIEIKGTPSELKRISILLNINNIRHIINDDLEGEIPSNKKEAYFNMITQLKSK